MPLPSQGSSGTLRKGRPDGPSGQMHDAIDRFKKENSKTHCDRDWKGQLQALTECRKLLCEGEWGEGLLKDAVLAAGECLPTGRSEVVKDALEFLLVRPPLNWHLLAEVVTRLPGM
jgi:hypothetical protein